MVRRLFLPRLRNDIRSQEEVPSLSCIFEARTGRTGIRATPASVRIASAGFIRTACRAGITAPSIAKRSPAPTPASTMTALSPVLISGRPKTLA